MRDDQVYLKFIRESIDRVELYTRDGEAAFTGDVRTQDAVLRRMETLADAAAHLSDELKSRHPTIAWRQVSDFRNVLAHGYMEIRLDQVWHVITHDLPALAAAVDAEIVRH